MEIFSKLCVYFLRRLGNNSHNLTYCFSLQSVVVYNFSDIVRTFLVPFWECVADCSSLRRMVFICLIKRGKHDWFLHAELLLDWLISLLSLLESVCCSKYSTKATVLCILNLWLPLLHLFFLKQFGIFVKAK